MTLILWFWVNTYIITLTFDNTRYLRPAGYDHKPCNLRPTAARVIETYRLSVFTFDDTRYLRPAGYDHGPYNLRPIAARVIEAFHLSAFKQPKHKSHDRQQHPPSERWPYPFLHCHYTFTIERVTHHDGITHHPLLVERAVLCKEHRIGLHMQEDAVAQEHTVPHHAAHIARMHALLAVNNPCRHRTATAQHRQE